jgi:hypothetical protein
VLLNNKRRDIVKRRARHCPTPPQARLCQTPGARHCQTPPQARLCQTPGATLSNAGRDIWQTPNYDSVKLCLNPTPPSATLSNAPLPPQGAKVFKRQYDPKPGATLSNTLPTPKPPTPDSIPPSIFQARHSQTPMC